jgi:hypothetical protein
MGDRQLSSFPPAPMDHALLHAWETLNSVCEEIEVFQRGMFLFGRLRLLWSSLSNPSVDHGTSSLLKHALETDMLAYRHSVLEQAVKVVHNHLNQYIEKDKLTRTVPALGKSVRDLRSHVQVIRESLEAVPNDAATDTSDCDSNYPDAVLMEKVKRSLEDAGTVEQEALHLAEDVWHSWFPDHVQAHLVSIADQRANTYVSSRRAVAGREKTQVESSPTIPRISSSSHDFSQLLVTSEESEGRSLLRLLSSDIVEDEADVLLSAMLDCMGDPQVIELLESKTLFPEECRHVVWLSMLYVIRECRHGSAGDTFRYLLPLNNLKRKSGELEAEFREAAMSFWTPPAEEMPKLSEKDAWREWLERQSQHVRRLLSQGSGIFAFIDPASPYWETEVELFATLQPCMIPYNATMAEMLLHTDWWERPTVCLPVVLSLFMQEGGCNDFRHWFQQLNERTREDFMFICKNAYEEFRLVATVFIRTFLDRVWADISGEDSPLSPEISLL